MTIKLNSTLADTRRENDGEWIEIPEWPGAELRVRSLNYGPFGNARSIVLGRLARRYGRDPVPTDVGYREDAKLYAEHILLDWRGFDEPYSRERALEILSDPAGHRWHENIRYAATKVGQTEAEFVEDAAKNSQRSFSGGSKAAAQPPTG